MTSGKLILKWLHNWDNDHPPTYTLHRWWHNNCQLTRWLCWQDDCASPRWLYITKVTIHHQGDYASPKWLYSKFWSDYIIKVIRPHQGDYVSPRWFYITKVFINHQSDSARWWCKDHLRINRTSVEMLRCITKVISLIQGGFASPRWLILFVISRMKHFLKTLIEVG